jgi:probable HAF family extracellular repeat protein
MQIRRIPQLFLLMLAMLATGAAPARAQAYTVTQLRNPNIANFFNVIPTDISEDGKAVGTWNVGGLNPAIQWWYWTPDSPNGSTGTMNTPGNFGFRDFSAEGVNDRGQVACWAGQQFTTEFPRVWENGALSALLLPPFSPGGPLRANNGRALAINQAGRIAGSADNNIAFWSGPGTVAAITRSATSAGRARSINSFGQMTGNSNMGRQDPTNPNYNPFGEAFILQSPTGTVNYLGRLPGTAQSDGFAINDLSEVVGACAIGFSGQGNLAFLYSGGQMIGLGTLSQFGDINSFAQDINNHGVVVGTSSGGFGARAFIWDRQHGMRDLNALAGIQRNTPGYLTAAYGINDAGQIVAASGSGAVLLTPNDSTPPVTTASLSGTPGGDGWFLGPVHVTLSATDGGSGVAATYYSVDGGPTQSYAGTFSVSGDGTHTVSFWSVDQAGNQEAPNSRNFKIDATPPVTTASLSGPPGNNDWYRGPVEVTLSAADGGSGIAATCYSVDGGPAQTYMGPFTVSGDGTHTVSFWSVDQAGNEETPNSRSFKIDATPPTTAASLSGPPGNNGWYRGPVEVTLSAADGGSGLAATYYSVDGGPAQTYTDPFTVSGDGTHTVSFWSVDQAGNEEAPNSLNFKIDATPPALSVAANPSLLKPVNGPNKPKMVAVTVTGSAVDAASGVDPGSGQYSVSDEYGTVQPAGSFTIQADGSFSFTVMLEATLAKQDKSRQYVITVSAADLAGNAGSASTIVRVAHH